MGRQKSFTRVQHALVLASRQAKFPLLNVDASEFFEFINECCGRSRLRLQQLYCPTLYFLSRRVLLGSRA